MFKKRDIVYHLKLKASRVFFSEMDKRFALMPFTLRAFEDEKKARMGVVECVKHGLCDPYPVIFEREGEIVAQVKENRNRRAGEGEFRRNCTIYLILYFYTCLSEMLLDSAS